MSELVRTEDGSLTRYDAETGELYHNRAGAYTEALKNYVEPSDAVQTLQAHGNLFVLDACFGLGYNTLVLLEQLLRSRVPGSVSVTAVETDPGIIAGIDSVLEDTRLQTVRRGFGERLPIKFGHYAFNLEGLAVELKLLQSDLRDFASALDDAYDLIFHDPFSPRKIPELWTVDIFGRYFAALNPRAGRLLTYSTAAAVSGGLRLAGFRLFRTEAVGGKSGGTLATTDPLYKPHGAVRELSKEQLERLDSASGVPYRDPTYNESRDEIFRRRAREQGVTQGLGDGSPG